MKIAFCLAIGLLLVLLSPPSSLSQVLYGQDQADVTLTIETYGKVAQGPDGCDITMNPVTPDMIASPLPKIVNGTCCFDVETNVNAVLKCPASMTLENDIIYTLVAMLALVNVNVPVEQCDNNDNWCAYYEPGYYACDTQLWVSLEKDWTVEDLADTYHGTVELTLWSVD